jgi:hypothetical protein
MYAGLTTNIPREIMGFSDFPFSPAMMAGSSIDSRRFPCSDEVRQLLGVIAAAGFSWESMLLAADLIRTL